MSGTKVLILIFGVSVIIRAGFLFLLYKAIGKWAYKKIDRYINIMWVIWFIGSAVAWWEQRENKVKGFWWDLLVSFVSFTIFTCYIAGYSAAIKQLVEYHGIKDPNVVASQMRDF